MEITHALKCDASDGIESCPVAVEDGLDVSDVLSFKYCKVNIPGPGCDREPFTEQFEGCQCEEICAEGNCSCLTRHGRVYDDQGRLLYQPSESMEMIPVIECNKSCKCSEECSQRVAQLSVTLSLEIFYAANKGYGLRTLDYIPQKSFVCEYAGEVISLAEARSRAELQKQTDKNYILILNEVCGGTDDNVWRTCVDPEHIGNIGRFINHSCEPNLFMIPVRVNNNIPKLSLFATRVIEPGEELTFSYAGKRFKSKTDTNSESSLNGRRLKKCLCGTMLCQGYLPYDTELYSSLEKT